MATSNVVIDCPKTEGRAPLPVSQTSTGVEVKITLKGLKKCVKNPDTIVYILRDTNITRFIRNFTKHPTSTFLIAIFGGEIISLDDTPRTLKMKNVEEVFILTELLPPGNKNPKSNKTAEVFILLEARDTSVITSSIAIRENLDFKKPIIQLKQHLFKLFPRFSFLPDWTREEFWKTYTVVHNTNFLVDNDILKSKGGLSWGLYGCCEHGRRYEKWDTKASRYAAL